MFTVDEAGARDFVQGGKDEAVQESIQDVSNWLLPVLVVTDHGLIAIEDAVASSRLGWGNVGQSRWLHLSKVEQKRSSRMESNPPDHSVLTTKDDACQRYWI